MRPVALAVRESVPGFEEQHVEAARGELLGNDRAAAAGADDDHVTHRVGRLPSLPVALELLAPVGDAGVLREPPAERASIRDEGDKVGQVADEEPNRARALGLQTLDRLEDMRLLRDGEVRKG